MSLSPQVCKKNYKVHIPDMGEECEFWLVTVTDEQSITNPDKDHAYLTDDNSLYVYNGKELVLVGFEHIYTTSEDLDQFLPNYDDCDCKGDGCEDYVEKLAIKETAEGNPTIISDSADWRLKKLNIYGQSSQDGTPSVENPIPIISKEVSEIKVTNGADLSQTITLTDPITLRGIPVTLVDGNIVINGEQYISDCIKEKDGIIGIERNLNELLVSSLGSNKLNQGAHTNGQNYLSCNAGRAYRLTVPLSNRYRGTQFTMDDECVYIPGPSGFIITDSRFTDKETAISIITEEQTKVVYVMNEPTFEPLPEDIQAQYKALKSYYPNTVIQTGCWNEVEYVADTKMYIDKKLSEISSQLTELKADTLLLGGM